MKNEEMSGSSESRAKYVWDRDKLSWVESAAEPGTAGATFDAIVEEERAGILSEGAAASVEASKEVDELQRRGAFIRSVGMAIDMVVLTLITGIVQVIFGSGSAASAFLMPLAGFAYFVGFWTLRGQTPGKAAIGAKIVLVDGSPAGFLRLLARYAVYLTYFYAMAVAAAYWVGFPLVVALILFSTVALSRSKRGLHDLVAGTMVIDSRPQLMEDYEEDVWEAAEVESDALLFEED